MRRHVRQHDAVSRLLPLHQRALADAAELVRSSLGRGGRIRPRGDRAPVELLLADAHPVVSEHDGVVRPDDVVITFGQPHPVDVTAGGVTVRFPAARVTDALRRQLQIALWYELLALLDSRTADAELDGLLAARSRWRAAGLTVVWTNGCFDLLHAGHVWLLEEARAMGDVLVVGVNTDASIRRLKGADRPFVPLEGRVRVLRGLRAVDHVITLRGDTPSEEIGRLRPDICVKDDTYRTLPLPEREVVEGYGGRMELLPRVPGLSSTALARHVRGQAVGA